MRGAEQSQDIWLTAGQSGLLPAGSVWVMEGWPQARLSLLMQAPTRVPTALARA